jgi:hypothetical protein
VAADDAAADDVAASSDTSSGTNWLEQNTELVSEPWDSDEDIDGLRQFLGRGALVTPWTTPDFVNPPFFMPGRYSGVPHDEFRKNA